MVSDQTLDRFRSTAALLAAVPGLAAKVRIGDQTCLEIRPTPADDVRHRCMAPETFRRAIAGARHLRKAGEQIASDVVPAGHEPAVDWGVPPGGRVMLAGVVRVPRLSSWLHATVVLADQATVDGVLSDDQPVPVLAHHDAELGASVLCARTGAGDTGASRRVTEALVTLVARIGVEDLESRLALRVANPLTDSRRPPR